jgi:ribonuclease-3
MDLKSFETLLGIPFKNKELLKQAFTHRSYLNENKKSNLNHNERLEFLGDAVLELVSTVFLFEKFPNMAEGEMTSLRAAIVNATTLSVVAKKLNMDAYLLLSRGETKDTGKARQIILANTIEAFIGAIFLDQGYDAAKKFVTDHIAVLIDDVVAKGAWVDAKSFFQEKSQDKVGVTPSYKVLKETGPDHDKQFIIGVYLKDEKVADGIGKSKQEAEQAAAEAGLKAKKWK